MVETFRIAVPGVLIDAGTKLACIPEGSPLAVNDTVPVNPFRAATLTLKLVLCPMPIVCEAGVAEIEKSGLPLVLPTDRLKLAL